MLEGWDRDALKLDVHNVNGESGDEIDYRLQVGPTPGAPVSYHKSMLLAVRGVTVNYALKFAYKPDMKFDKGFKWCDCS